MNITYEIEGISRTTDKSNNDLIIIETHNKNHTTISIKALRNIKLIESVIKKNIKIDKNTKLFFNGYQSWTDTKEFLRNEKEKNILKPALRRKVVKSFGLDKYGDSSFYNYKFNKKHGYDFFYYRNDINDTNSRVLYNLNSSNAYLIFEYVKPDTLNLISDIKGKELDSNQEYIVYSYKEFDSFDLGLKEFGLDFTHEGKKIFGYTSWYDTYQNINEEMILDKLEHADKRFNLFQIDDGYETHVGDWLSIDKNKFKSGLKPIVDKIHEKNMLAGIWLAPFAAEEESELFKNHKNWFLKDQNNEFIKAGCNWNGFYALDLTKEEVREYIKECLGYYSNLGFDFFKLDFVYAASIVVPKGYTRSEWQNYTYSFLRNILKDKLILGCGANLFNSYNNFDYLRVGSDVSFDFDDKPYMRLLHRERNSTKNTILNTIYRSIFDNHLFLNDSDVFLLRDTNTTMSFETRKALIKINSLASSVLMTSDDIASYDEAKQKVLEEALDAFYNKQEVKYIRNGNFIDFEINKGGLIQKFRYSIRKGRIYDR